MKKFFNIFVILLFSANIFADYAVYTVTSKTTLQVEGEPANSEYFFEQTGNQKFRMTAGTSTTLRLTGYQNAQIQTVKLSMKSNQSGGSGSLKMTIDGKEVWTIPEQSFSDDDWYGSFSTEYVDIVKILDETNQGSTIEIVIESTENSIYINKFEFAYTNQNNNQGQDNLTNPNDDDNKNPSDETTYTVTFKSNIPGVDDWIAQVPKEGSVMCPAFDYQNDYWQFHGWSNSIYETTTTTIGPVLFANDIIDHVYSNEEFNAVYIHKPTIDLADTLISGDYILTLNSSNTSLVLWSTDSSITYETIDYKTFDSPLIYKHHIELISDSTLCIKFGNQYLQPDSKYEFLKYGDSKFVWNYNKKTEKTYYIYTLLINQKMYIGFLNYKPKLFDESKYNQNYSWQFYMFPFDINVRYFCSYPEGKPTSLNTTNEHNDIKIIGSQIINLSCRHIQIFNINGQLLYTSDNAYIDMSNLNTGFYIINIDNSLCLKYIKR